MLRVTVAEVQRSLLKQFGINIAADINAGNFITSVMTARPAMVRLLRAPPWPTVRLLLLQTEPAPVTVTVFLLLMEL